MPRNSRSKPDDWVGPQLSVSANNERFYGGIRVDGEVFNVGDAVQIKCEDRMEALGVSERAARLLHMGQRVEDAMDFEKDLNLHEEDYNAKPPRS